MLNETVPGASPRAQYRCFVVNILGAFGPERKKWSIRVAVEVAKNRER